MKIAKTYAVHEIVGVLDLAIRGLSCDEIADEIHLTSIHRGEGSMRSPPVKEWRRYLRSGAWAAKRMEAVRRAGFRCQECGRSNFDVSKFQVHHLTYEHFGRERVEDLRVLCRRCHRRIST